MKAKKLFTTYGRFENTVTYEYRGHEYEVTFPQRDDMFNVPAWKQHKDNQKRIDKMIEENNQESKKPVRYEDTAAYGLELCMKVLGW